MSKPGAADLACVFALLGGLVHGPALAQTATPAKAGTAAEAAAAMERAQRLAANPMRVILEAGKFKRKVGADDVTLEAADAASLRRTAARGNAGAELVPAVARPAVDTVAAPPPAVQPRVAQPEPVIGVTSSTLSAPQDAMPALESAGAQLVNVAPLPPSAPALATLATLAVAKPRLIESVDPVFPGRLIDDAALLTEVMADLTLRPDGGVAQVTLLGAVPRALQRSIVSALEQWRFAPLPSQQIHRVQLVFAGK